LQQSVKEEKYEQAAEIRDQIKLLEKQINEEESK
jgi:protein-arginine kinase activator protein McsA